MSLHFRLKAEARTLSVVPVPAMSGDDASALFRQFWNGVTRPLGLLVGQRHRSRSLHAKAKEDGRLNELPVNPHPHVAPTLPPTLKTGVAAMAAAAMAWNAA